MINLKEHIDILNIAKTEFKKHCKTQVFCNSCNLYNNSNDTVDCFHKFYTLNLCKFENIYLNYNNKDAIKDTI